MYVQTPETAYDVEAAWLTRLKPTYVVVDVVPSRNELFVPASNVNAVLVAGVYAVDESIVAVVDVEFGFDDVAMETNPAVLDPGPVTRIDASHRMDDTVGVGAEHGMEVVAAVKGSLYDVISLQLLMFWLYPAT